MKKFCDYCLKEVSCSYHEKETTINIDNIPIKYLKKYYIGDTCKHEFLDDLLDYDVHTVNNELRKHTGLITVGEIEEILTKYNIGKKPLSLVLGIGEVNIIRYLDGVSPTRDISDLLKNVLNNPFLFELFLYANKDKISEIAYKKALGKTKQLEFMDNKSKLYSISLYFISKLNEIDPLSLQKLLYFSELFSKIINNKRLFLDKPKAWKYGPVYDEIYDCFSYYKGNKIDYSELLKDREFDLTEEEKDFLNEIIKDFGCYSGPILREMSHLTDPWIHAREGIDDGETSTRIIEEDEMNEYFEKIKNEYKIYSIQDISKFSEDLFNKVKENLIK